MAEQQLTGWRVLVTRPAHQAGDQIRHLKALGAEPVPLPLLEIAPIDDSEPAALQAIKTQILELDLYAGVIFVSPNAARIGADWIDQYWPQLPLGVDWLAVGAATAATLAEAGIPASHVPGGYDSEALLSAPQLQQVAGKRYLIMRGVGGRELLADTLRARGARVEYADLYRRRCPDYPAAVIQSTIFKPHLSAILITSGQALEHLFELAGASPTLFDTLMVVPSRRVAELAQARGCNRIRIAAGADDRSMIHALAPAD